MKKCLSVLMAAIMLFSFAACSNSAEKNKPETTSNTTAAPSAENTEENQITLITCVENQKEYRRCIQAVQVSETKEIF